VSITVIGFIAVATTIGRELLAHEIVTLSVILAGLLSAVGWSILTWSRGTSSSSSHALIFLRIRRFV
jgi:inorganic phosphate transporter, PiT family